MEVDQALGGGVEKEGRAHTGRRRKYGDFTGDEKEVRYSSS